jgi:LacI family transcriptional regulator
MSVTIKDIALEVGVSYSTVSKALNDSPLVKEKTKAKIIKAANRMGYQPNFVARSLVSKRSKIIGAVWPRAERITWLSLIADINRVLAKHSYNLLLSIDPVYSAVEIFNRFRVDAILIFREYLTGNSKLAPMPSVPILYFGNPNFSSVPTINVDREKALFLAVHHLTRLGHRRIAYIGDLSPADPTQQEKVEGFKKALAALELPQNPEMTFDTQDSASESGYFATKQLLRSDSWPTALVVGSHSLSQGVMHALNEANIRVPDDLSVVGYDHVPEMTEPALPLTTVGPSPDTMAEIIVGTLTDLIDHPDRVPNYTRIDVELVERASCAPPRASR